MVELRFQEDDPVPQWFSRWEEANEQRFSRWEEAYDQWISRLEAMTADFLCRSRKENPEDQICNEEELAEIEAETKSNGSEDRAVENEANATMISAIDKDESIPQFQVPIANSEILKSSESGKVDLGLAKLEVGGDVERGQKMISDTKTGCAHKVLVKMPSKEKRMKHLKAWKFKFKSTSKRSRLIDDKFAFVDATVWLNKEPQETIWDYVKKEFKGTMAACGKTIIDRFKLVHATPRPGVYDRPLQTRVWDSGGSFLECVDEESFGDDRSREVIAELNSYTGLTHLDKIKEWLFKVEEFFSIDFTPMELKDKLALNHFEGQLLRQFQELCEKLSLASMMFEQTFSSITEPKKILPSFFCLKHKWKSRLSHSFSETKQRMIGRVWKSLGYLVEDMMEEDQKLQGDSEPLLTVPDFAAKICETLDQYIRKKGSVSADRGSESNQSTLRFSTWVIEILRNHYMVLLLTTVAYAIHFLGGVGIDKKQSHLSLWINRVWDPGRSLVKDASYSIRIFSSLPATVPVSLLCQESFAYQITSFSTNLEVKVSLKREDLIQDERREKRARVARENEDKLLDTWRVEIKSGSTAQII